MIVFYNDGTTTIRSMEKEDAEVLYEAYKSFGYHRDIATFKKYYEEQTSGKRKVFISEYQKEICGICTLIINSTTGPWAEMGLPEIVDLSVFLTHQRMGIGNKLLDVAENEASKIADTVFLAVGLHSGKTRMCWICDKETEELIKTKSSENSMSFTAVCSVCGTPYGSGSPFSK